MLTVSPADLQKEFVHGGFYDATIGLLMAAIPMYRDPALGITHEDIRQMLRDPAVIAAVDALTLGVLADGINITPAIDSVPQWQRAGADPQKVADGDQAALMSEFVSRQLQAMDGEILDVAEGLLAGMCHGWQAAEATYAYVEDGPDVGRLGLASLTCKPRSRMTPVLDQSGRLLGYLADNGQGSGIVGGSYLDATQSEAFHAALKFATYIHRPTPELPLGTSILAPAYNSWFIKSKILPDFLRYLKQFASPAIIGKTAPSSPDEFLRDGMGRALIDATTGQPAIRKAVEALLQHLLGWLNSSIICVPSGTEIDLVKSEGDGAAFREAGDWFDRQIHLAVLGTPQATLEAQAESRSSKGVAQDLLGMRIRYIRRRLGNALTWGVARPLTIINFGQQAARFAPRISLQAAEQQDQLPKVEAYTKAKAGGLIYPSQEPWVFEDLGWPQPDWEAEAAREQAAQDAQQQAALERSRLFLPGGGQAGA